MQAPTLSLTQIQRGNNPRNHFDEAEMAELVASVKEQGVLQPILVRPLNDGYQIVAGERRYRAALAAFGENWQIPVTIKVMTDAEADAAALVENIMRANMSPTEEAVAAAKVVGRMKGDRDEASKVLGWSRSTLDSRLALMNCSPGVRSALDTRQILLSHAELLAALAKETQEKILPVLIKEKKTVAELKAVIENASSKLSAAIFDKADCAACPHNSSLQTTMFAESITDGHCTNSACFKEKTESAINAIADGLKEEYPVIRIVRAGDNHSLVKLQADGLRGVGQEQADACRSCADFGAAVSSLPQAMGVVYKDQCFNPTCNATKVAARIKAEEAAAAPPAPAASAAKAAPAGTATSAADVKPKEEAKPVTSVSENERIKAYRVKVWRKAMRKEIGQNPALSGRYLVALCLNGNARNINSSWLGKAFEKLTGKQNAITSLDENAALIQECTPEQLATMTTLLAASAMDDIDVHHLQRLARHHQLDLSKHWALDKELLDILTKSEIEFMAKEVGLNKSFGDGFKKLFTEKKSDLIDKLLKVDGFNYSATIPAVIQY